ncbi:hypothetical protein K435DRAFT_810498 [Dendrothele bispora CBS 962.96]|uniref:Uncharacterized protein n=1 Tax=Dendrothele bispora (strain CBS 962.96) TaxID=1314807 RepID=A0A4V4HBJ4_DENBC|nr:hypothetical protein K435DRAFT_810498 [Dendrothele bispora CBS 962.96]
MFLVRYMMTLNPEKGHIRTGSWRRRARSLANFLSLMAQKVSKYLGFQGPGHPVTLSTIYVTITITGPYIVLIEHTQITNTHTDVDKCYDNDIIRIGIITPLTPRKNKHRGRVRLNKIDTGWYRTTNLRIVEPVCQTGHITFTVLTGVKETRKKDVNEREKAVLGKRVTTSILERVRETEVVVVVMSYVFEDIRSESVSHEFTRTTEQWQSDRYSGANQQVQLDVSAHREYIEQTNNIDHPTVFEGDDVSKHSPSSLNLPKGYTLSSAKRLSSGPKVTGIIVKMVGGYCHRCCWYCYYCYYHEVLVIKMAVFSHKPSLYYYCYGGENSSLPCFINDQTHTLDRNYESPSHFRKKFFQLKPYYI